MESWGEDLYRLAVDSMGQAMQDLCDAGPFYRGRDRDMKKAYNAAAYMRVTGDFLCTLLGGEPDCQETFDALKEQVKEWQDGWDELITTKGRGNV